MQDGHLIGTEMTVKRSCNFTLNNYKRSHGQLTREIG